MKYILAIDQGTTTTHVALVDENGNLIDVCHKEVSLIYSHPGWVEQNPLQLMKTTIALVHEILEKTKIPFQSIKALGITNQRETTLLWNKKTGQTLSNAIVWQDRRTADFCNYLKKQGGEKSIKQKTGLTLDPYFSATKLHYLLEHSKQAKELAEQDLLAFGTVDSWIIWNLTKGQVHATDVSNASRTLLFNIHKLDWDQDLLDLFNIPKNILPKVTSSAEMIGNAFIEGFATSIPITAVVGDQSAALFGQLCHKPGMSKITFGTGCFNLLNTGSKVIDSKHNLISTIAWKIGEELQYALEGSVFIGGAVIQWLKDNLNMVQNYDEIEKVVNSVEDTDGVYFVPAFTGLAAPHWRPTARGTILGLTRNTQKAHLIRAALEGIAFQVSDLIEILIKDSPFPIKEIRVDGGASKSNLLMQFQANLLNIPIVRPQCIETTSLGVGYLAGIGAGFWKINDIDSFWKPEKTFEPQSTLALSNRKIKWKKALECVKLWEADE